MDSKVLVACPVWEFDKQYIDDFIKQFNSEYDIFFVDNTLGTDRFYQWLKRRDVDTFRMIWNPKHTYHLNMLAQCCEIIRSKVIDNDYTHWFWLGADTLVPRGTINELVHHDKDIVGVPTNLAFTEADYPAVWEDPNLMIINRGTNKTYLNVVPWDKIKPLLYQVAAIGGADLIKRKVLEQVDFYWNRDYLWGEDLWFYHECREHGIEFWCDGMLRARNQMNKLPLKKNFRTEWTLQYYNYTWKKYNKGTVHDMVMSEYRRPKD